MPTWPQSITFRDVAGVTGTTHVHVTADTLEDAAAQVEPLLAELQELTVAAVAAARGAYTTPSGPLVYGIHHPDAYINIGDKVIFYLMDAAGGLRRFTVPAPRRHPSKPAVAAVIARLTNGSFTTASGTPYIRFVNTERTFHHHKRSPGPEAYDPTIRRLTFLDVQRDALNGPRSDLPELTPENEEP